MNQKISVITTVFNCEKYVSQSINSILDQTFGEIEYIIVNDGSTDRTPEIISELASRDSRIIAINNETNLGRVKSLNKALEVAHCKYIALQDADDVSLPKRLEQQYEFLENNPDHVLVGTNIVVMDENGNFISKPVRPENDREAKFSLLFRCTFANPSIMFRRNVIEDNNLKYEDDFIHAEDFRIISLISRYGKISNIQDVLVKYRKHPNNNSFVNYDIVRSGSAVIVKENLDRLGFNIEEPQINRIIDLMSSRGINHEFLYEDVNLIFQTIKSFKRKNLKGKNKEVLNTLKRMSGWLGRRNIISKPKYLTLYLSIKTYYYKESFFSSN